MLDLKDFSFKESQNIFDLKGFLLKVVGYWKWIVACIIVFLFAAYQVNIRKEKVYALNSLIVIREESSPLLTSNTSLIFNWGGVSDKVQTVIATLKSRNHNELVVEELEYYIDYLIKSKYDYVDAYGRVPFKVNIDKTKPQLLNQPISIKFLSETEYELSVLFEEEEARTISYVSEAVENFPVEKTLFTKKYKVGEKVDLPFINWKLQLGDTPFNYIGNEYFVRFRDFNSTVATYQRISANSDSKLGGSILKLELEGTNKKRIVEYLNTTVDMIRENQLESKNIFAVNTIRFIDSTLARLQDESTKTSSSLMDFMKDKNVYEISEQGEGMLMSRLAQYDVDKETVLRKIQYYKTLEYYLTSNSDFSKLPAPTVAGIDDENIKANVSKLIAFSVQQSKTTFGYKNQNTFKQLDSEMEAIKLVLLENISSAKSALDYDLRLVNSKINDLEGSIRKMPRDKQEQTEILRKYNLEQQFLNIFLTKRSEAEIMKAASLSDVHFIDRAKDVGGGLIGPKTSVNYIIAVFGGILIPILILLIVFLLDSGIKNAEDVNRLSKVPIIGILSRKHKSKSNLAVFEQSKSALAETFRAVRSSLQFMYKKKNIVGSKTLMITSSISGEGKTFCAINLATVFALSEKKTVVIGFDFRKPKISENFNVDKDTGVVNYLIGQKTIDEVIQHTEIPYLDVITSGPVPPNPSELIISDGMPAFFEQLQKRYDYIILDTPPVGLVTDAMELVPYCDAILYVVRQNVTKKSMLSIVNKKQKNGELPNVSLLLNGFENKTKYGYSYGYGYGEYGESSGYYDSPQDQSWLKRIGSIFKKK